MRIGIIISEAHNYLYLQNITQAALKKTLTPDTEYIHIYSE